LLQARQLFDGRSVVTYPSPRGEEEGRLVLAGVVDDRMVAVVWLPREDGTRLISLSVRPERIFIKSNA